VAAFLKRAVKFFARYVSHRRARADRQRPLLLLGDPGECLPRTRDPPPAHPPLHASYQQGRAVHPVPALRLGLRGPSTATAPSPSTAGSGTTTTNEDTRPSARGPRSPPSTSEPTCLVRTPMQCRSWPWAARARSPRSDRRGICGWCQPTVPHSRTMRILAAGRGGGQGFSFEPAGFKTSSATVVAGAATKGHWRRPPGLTPWPRVPRARLGGSRCGPNDAQASRDRRGRVRAGVSKEMSDVAEGMPQLRRLAKRL
jgi:hypothetical protein